MTGTSLTFSPFAIARVRLVLLGPSGVDLSRIIDPVRSLKECEIVSAAEMIEQEVTRGSALGMAARRARAAGHPLSDETLLTVLRRWYWSRRGTRGFVLTGFPASVPQAMVFDQWLEERDEALTAGVWCDDGSAPDAVAAYYRTRGMLETVALTGPADAAWSALVDLVNGHTADR